MLVWHVLQRFRSMAEALLERRVKLGAEEMAQARSRFGSFEVVNRCNWSVDLALDSRHRTAYAPAIVACSDGVGQLVR